MDKTYAKSPLFWGSLLVYKSTSLKISNITTFNPMRKFMLSTFFIVIMSTVASSQWIIEGGLSVSSLRNSNGIFFSETFSRIGFQAGIYKRSPMNDHFYFSPGVRYNQKGAGFGAFVPDLDLNYLEFPFLFVYQKDLIPGFFAEAGPYISYLLSANDGFIDVKDDYKNLDFGINIGAGFDLGRMMIGGRGVIGLANIPSTIPGTMRDTRITNVNGQLFLGVKI